MCIYNDSGLLTKIYHFAQLIADNPEKGEVDFRHYQQFVTEYGYDPETKQLLWIKQGGDTTKSFTYNNERLPIAISSADGYVLHQSYDERGHLNRTWDSSDSGFEYRYDDRDRLLQVRGPEGLIEYVYVDSLRQNLIQDALGAVTTYSFDSFGNLHNVQDPIGGETRYEYDEEGLLTRVILPNGSLREISRGLPSLPKTIIW